MSEYSTPIIGINDVTVFLGGSPVANIKNGASVELMDDGSMRASGAGITMVLAAGKWDSISITNGTIMPEGKINDKDDSVIIDGLLPRHCDETTPTRPQEAEAPGDENGVPRADSSITDEPPVGTQVTDDEGNVWERRGSGWHYWSPTITTMRAHYAPRVSWAWVRGFGPLRLTTDEDRRRVGLPEQGPTQGRVRVITEDGEQVIVWDRGDGGYQPAVLFGQDVWCTGDLTDDERDLAWEQIIAAVKEADRGVRAHD